MKSYSDYFLKYKLSWSWGKPLKIFLKIPKIKRKKEEWVGVVEAWVDLTKDRKYIDNCDIYRLQPKFSNISLPLGFMLV